MCSEISDSQLIGMGTSTQADWIVCVMSDSGLVFEVMSWLAWWCGWLFGIWFIMAGLMVVGLDTSSCQISFIKSTSWLNFLRVDWTDSSSIWLVCKAFSSSSSNILTFFFDKSCKFSVFDKSYRSVSLAFFFCRIATWLATMVSFRRGNSSVMILTKFSRSWADSWCTLS